MIAVIMLGVFEVEPPNPPVVPNPQLEARVLQLLSVFPTPAEILVLREVARKTKDSRPRGPRDRWVATVYIPWSLLHAASRRDVLMEPETRMGHLKKIREIIGEDNFRAGKMPLPR